MSDRNTHLSRMRPRDSHSDPEMLIKSIIDNPPRRPAGWRRPPEGSLPEMTPEQRRHPHYPTIARAAWKAGRGYLLDWLWTICDSASVLPAWHQELHRREMAAAHARQMEDR